MSGKKTNFKDLSETILDAARILRKSLNASENYKPVLALLFIKRLNDTFEENVKKLIDSGMTEKEARKPRRHDFYVPPEAIWKVENAKGEIVGGLMGESKNVGSALIKVCKTIENSKGILEDTMSYSEFNKKQKSAIVKPTFSEETTVPYFGKNCILKINLDQKGKSIKFVNSQFIINLTSKRLLKKEVKRIYEEWLIIKATKYLKSRTVKLGTKIGLKPSKIQFKTLKGRWGSASKGTITLNSNLMKCSKDTIDYIIIHELCHLKIQDHSHRYWNLVRKHYPKYEEKVKELEILSRIVL